MIKLENYEVTGWEHVIRGMRNPMNSWDKSDSSACIDRESCMDCPMSAGPEDAGCVLKGDYVIGPNDHSLMMKLRNAGTDHRKFMRMITVYVDITAPLYWWKEFDTYKVGTVANSCSTMHKIHEKEFTMEDFSCEKLLDWVVPEDIKVKGIPMIEDPNDSYYEFSPFEILEHTKDMLNKCREMFLETKCKIYWWQMIQLLPSSYNQKRTVMMNYEVLANMYPSRKNHKLDEWHVLCDWIEGLPYSELIVGDGKHNPLAHPESYLDDTMAIVDDMTMAQRKELLKYLEEKIEGNKKPIMKKEWEVKDDAT